MSSLNKLTRKDLIRFFYEVTDPTTYKTEENARRHPDKERSQAAFCRHFNQCRQEVIDDDPNLCEAESGYKELTETVMGRWLKKEHKGVPSMDNFWPEVAKKLADECGLNSSDKRKTIRDWTDALNKMGFDSSEWGKKWEEKLSYRNNGKDSDDLFEKCYNELVQFAFSPKEEKAIVEESSKLLDYLRRQLIEMRNIHPSFTLMERANEELFPHAKLHQQARRDAKEYASMKIDAALDSNPAMPLAHIFRVSWAEEKCNHLIIEGEGGIGKTVTLLSLATDETVLPTRVGAIYIPMYRLNLEEADPIRSYIEDYVFLGAKRKEELWNDLEEQASKGWEKGPCLILLLDGFNEIGYMQRKAATQKLKDWLDRHSGVQIIASSRDNLQGDLAPIGEIHDVRLQHLSQETIRQYLKSRSVPVPEAGDALWNVINRPLMLALYAKNCTLADKGDPDLQLWPTPDNPGKIIWNYLQSELYHCKTQKEFRGWDFAAATALCEYIAPSICFDMSRKGTFVLREEEFEQSFNEAVGNLTRQMDAGCLPEHLGTILDSCEIDHFNRARLKNILRKELCIFLEKIVRQGENQKDRKEYQLMHQDFRDCFAALHLINQAECLRSGDSLPEGWKTPIDLNVMDFIVDLIPAEQADKLWETNRGLPDFDRLAMANQMRLQGLLRGYDYRELDFSGLDLREFSLFPYKAPGGVKMQLPSDPQKLCGTILTEQSFTAEGHAHSVDAVAITPDGKRCVSASMDTLMVRDMDSGECMFTLQGQIFSIKAVAITSDGKRCVSAGEEGISFSADDWMDPVEEIKLQVWDLESGNCLHSLKSDTGSIRSIAITPDDKWCVSASLNTLRVWDLDTGACRHILKGHSKRVSAVAITPDGNRCVSSSWDNTLRVWDLETGACLRTLEGHSFLVDAVAITPDGRRCVSASFDETLRVWNLETGTCLRILAGHTGYVTAVVITPDGKRCVSASDDESLRVWDLKTGTCLHAFQGNSQPKGVVAITPNGKCCVSTADDRTLRVWDLTTGSCLHILKGHTQSVNAVFIAPNGKKFVSASSDHSLRVWDIGSGACLYALEGQKTWIADVSISQDGKYCINISDDHLLHVWDLGNDTCLHVIGGHTDYVRAVAITPDGKRCVSASDDCTLRVWNLKTGSCIHTLKGHTYRVGAVAVTPDSKYCVSVSFDALRIWDLNTGECQFSRLKKGREFWQEQIIITPDGNRCITASNDNTLQVWDLKTGACLHILEGHSDRVEKYAINSDGSRCIGKSYDRTLRVWNLESGACLSTWDQDKDIGSIPDITSDGKYCAVDSLDILKPLERTLRVWNWDSSDCLHTLEGQGDALYFPNIAPDRKHCVTTSIISDTLCVWDLDTDTCIYTLDPIGTIKAITPDSKYCVTASSEGIFGFLNLETGKYDKIFRMIGDIDLRGINISQAEVFPPEFRETLRQNGAIV